ncbi:MAG: hypothetical protein NTW21_04330 [Verrucomicrobia bacterium]|nr:hypothetical protein [Verrucomicrobiota bacterium]
MDTFPVVKRKDLAKHGHYRTQQAVLEIHDALADSRQSGHPYQSRRDPPPADARCCHPARS